MIRLLPLILLFAACHETGPVATGFHAVGDSTLVLVEHYNGGHGSTASGKGYTDAAPNGKIEFTAAEQPVVVAGVSLWDVSALDLSGYTDLIEFYAPVPVVVVALPPTASVPDPSALNAAVAAELNCELQPASLRDVPTYDGVHPTVAGVAEIVLDFAALTAEDACG